MNNLRVESHVAQKNRRHKLRFQQNSGDRNHQNPPENQPHFEPNNTHKTFSYDPNVFPSEILNSIARNPHLLLPFASHDQDSCPDSGTGIGSSPPERILMSSNGGSFANLQTPQEFNSWNVVSYSNIDQKSFNSGCHGYYQDHLHNTPATGFSPFYQNTLEQEQVTLAQTHQNKSNPGINPSIPWLNVSDEPGFPASNIHEHGEHQATTKAANGLSLSLSSVPQAKNDEPTLQSGQKALKSDLLPDSDHKPFMGVSVSSFAHRNTGPLGPFTGYATIMKNSKYLKPAQELLSDNCDVGGQDLGQTCDVYSQKIIEDEMSRVCDDSGESYGGSNEHIGGRSSSGGESYRPEFHRKKAKLLYMQEEVCRRYKQYLQQMQLVISSFETVAGLSAATPFVCLALKAVSRHFHFVKNVISVQLSQMMKTVNEGLCSSTTTSSKVLDANATSTSSRIKSIGKAGFFAPQQPVWRPQRGLPERAISVLKAWLFDHFLHPYPSDADKHMLATQTGLTRNQVSNWFINARVRIWKPMVEEIHTLETKGLAEPNPPNPQTNGQDPSRMDMGSLSNTQPLEHSRNPRSLTTDEPNEPWDHEKRSRPEYQIPPSTMDHRFMTIMPYPQTGFESGGQGGLGPVSLTLGLRQNADHVQQLQQHFGGQLIHDFVG